MNDSIHNGAQIPAPPIQQKPEHRQYTAAESIGALCILLLSFLFCRTSPFGTYPLGNLIVCALALTLCAVRVSSIKRKGVSPLSRIFFVFSVLFCIAPLFCTQGILLFFCYAAFAVSALSFLYFSCGCGTGCAKAEYLFYDVKRALLSLPFSYGANALSAALYPIREGRLKSAGKRIGYVLLGLAAALIPTVFVAINLSFESKFTDLLGSIFSFNDIGGIFGYLLSALFAVPVALYLFSAVWQYAYHGGDEDERASVREKYDQSKNSLRKIPALSAVSAVLPILFIYSVFFISQLEEYTSAFTGVLPDGFNYAEYARSGFFELCRVSGLNALLILCSNVFVRRSGKDVSSSLRVMNAALCICSLVLIATALSKMLLYIDTYGMTRKRVYVSLFMILMAIGFVFALVSQLVRRIRMTWICVILAVLMLLIPAFLGVDGFIVEYNVDRYIDGTLESVDYDALADSYEAAMPALLKLYESEAATEDDKQTILLIARIEKGRAQTNSSIFRFSIPYLKATSAIEQITAE